MFLIIAYPAKIINITNIILKIKKNSIYKFRLYLNTYQQLNQFSNI